MPDNSRRINEQSMLIFNSILRVEGDRVEFLLHVELFPEHACFFDGFDHVAHVMRVISDGLALVGDADSGGHRITSSTRARLLA